jgi:hypothetical protein
MRKIKKRHIKKKKKRLAFKRPHDFWAGVATSSFISMLTFLIFVDLTLEIKALLFAVLLIKILFLFYLDASSKILRISLKQLMFWKKKTQTIEEYSVAIEYQTLIEMIESKKKLEDALKMIEGLENDKKISEFIKFMNDQNNNHNRIWKN